MPARTISGGPHRLMWPGESCTGGPDIFFLSPPPAAGASPFLARLPTAKFSRHTCVFYAVWGARIVDGEVPSIRCAYAGPCCWLISDRAIGRLTARSTRGEALRDFFRPAIHIRPCSM